MKGLAAARVATTPHLYPQPNGTERPSAHNFSLHDATAHAEIIALRDAGARVANYRLSGATVYVTIEPCQMCVGAMIHARIARVVYGTPELKAGAIESAMRAHEHPAVNHRLEATGGVLEAECRAVMQEFFKSRRT
jgi:tRNA(adenine34) deaminase